MPVATNDNHPRYATWYRDALVEEPIAYCERECTPIIKGRWKMNVHKGGLGKGFGFRRYHKHGSKWYCVVTAADRRQDSASTARWLTWQCGKCDESVPDEMEGYINLARWAANADS